MEFSRALSRGGAVLYYSGCLRHLGPRPRGGSRHPETGPTRSRCKQAPVHCSRPYGFQLRSHGIYSDRPHRSHARLPRRSSCAAVSVWSSLFWAGLFLIFVQNVDSKKWARWPTFSALSALPLLIFPEHYQAAAWGRHVHLIMESAATSLINGVCDTDVVAQMCPNPATVYSLAKQYRQRRLDMVADGCRIGWSFRNDLFGGHYKSVELKGSIAVQSLVQCANGAPAARVTGWAIERETSIPKQLILVNAGGKVCGLARPTEIRTNINPSINCLNSRPADFLVTFADYNPQTPYFVRSADDNRLSKETLRVTSSGPMAASN